MVILTSYVGTSIRNSNDVLSQVCIYSYFTMAFYLLRTILTDKAEMLS